MTYYESAKGIEITRKRALKELENHGAPQEEIDTFFQEVGTRETYAAQEVLDWLGY